MTDYEAITETLKEIEAERVGVVKVEFNNDLNPCKAEFWHIQPPVNKGVILLRYLDDSIGLYTFVGKHNDPVEKDIEFLLNLDEEMEELHLFGTTEEKFEFSNIEVD